MARSDLADSSESKDIDDLLPGSLSGRTVVSRSRRTPLVTVLWFLASIPTIALGLLLSMAVRVWIVDGAWPERNQPDPKDLGFHNSVTVVVILASFAAVLAVPLLALAGSRFSRRPVPLKPLALGIVGFAVLFVVLAGDVAGLGDWIGD